MVGRGRLLHEACIIFCLAIPTAAGLLRLALHFVLQSLVPLNPLRFLFLFVDWFIFILITLCRVRFRNLVRQYGCDIAYSPMIIAEDFANNRIQRLAEWETSEGNNALPLPSDRWGKVMGIFDSFSIKFSYEVPAFLVDFIWE